VLLEIIYNCNSTIKNFIVETGFEKRVMIFLKKGVR